MKKERISVIIPTLNEEKYLPNLLKSLEKQTYNDFEVIISDSYSKDKTVKIAKDFGAKVIFEKERNIGKSRHKGAEHSTGGILVHTSADVIAPKNWLEELSRPILLGTADLSYGSIYLQESEFIEKLFEHSLNKLVVPIISKINMVYATADNIAIKKQFYSKIGGIDTSLHTGEDTDLVKRAKQHGKVFYVHQAKIFTHPRRIRKWGKLKYFSFHFRNFLDYNFAKKTQKEYEPIR